MVSYKALNTTIEHTIHIRHIRSVEIRYINGGKAIAFTKHAPHISHVPCIKLRYIKGGKSIASQKHTPPYASRPVYQT